ncbi:MAG: arginase family protein [Hyphomicrobiaceae bacterium]
MKITLIYAYWPNQPFEVTWCDLPWALRDAGLAKRLHGDDHDVRESILMSEEDNPEELRSGFILARQIADEIKTARAQGELPVTLCGSCALAALANISALGGEDTGVAWFDAHPDLNTPETTTSGLLEGMAHATIAGLAWYGMAREHAKLDSPVSLEKSALYGARDIDEAEAALLDMHAIPIAKTAAEINARLQGCKATYVHLDMDVHDDLTVRTNTFSVPDGPSVDEVRSTLTAIDNIQAIAVTGLDPAAADTAKASRIAIEHVLAIANHLTDTAEPAA